MIHHPDLIVPGQVWAAASGNGHAVRITSTNRYGNGTHDVDVAYEWYVDGKRREHDKDSFSFQCRYFNADLDGKGSPSTDQLQRQAVWSK